MKHLDARYALREPATRNVLDGFVCNSMPDTFVEGCALALDTQQYYEWFDAAWLKQRQHLFSDRTSKRWQFIAYIVYRMTQLNDPTLRVRASSAINDFRQLCDQRRPTLFPDNPSVLHERCQCLLDILAESSGTDILK